MRWRSPYVPECAPKSPPPALKRGHPGELLSLELENDDVIWRLRVKYLKFSAHVSNVLKMRIQSEKNLKIFACTLGKPKNNDFFRLVVCSPLVFWKVLWASMCAGQLKSL